MLAPGKSNRSAWAIYYSFTTGSRGSDGGPRCGGVASQNIIAGGTVLERRVSGTGQLQYRFQKVKSRWMISERVQKAIDSARKFGEQLEEIVVGKKSIPDW